MKKIITLLLCCLLAVDTTLHAMLFIPEECEQEIKLKTIQDVPKISLKKIGADIAQLSPKKSASFKKQLSNSFTFNIILLPKELREKIISNMFHGNTQLAEAYYKVPFLYACKRYHEARITASKDNLSEKETEELTMQIFALPTYQKTMINNVINPSFGTQLAYSGSIISEDTLAMIDEKIIKKMFQNQNIVTVQKLEEQLPLCIYAVKCLTLTTLLTASTTVAMYTIPFITCSSFGYCPSLALLFSVTSTTTKVFAVCCFAITSAIIRKRDDKKKLVF
jgi:hypothetical protein